MGELMLLVVLGSGLMGLLHFVMVFLIWQNLAAINGLMHRQERQRQDTARTAAARVDVDDMTRDANVVHWPCPHCGAQQQTHVAVWGPQQTCAHCKQSCLLPKL